MSRRCQTACGLRADHSSQEMLATRKREPRNTAMICTFSTRVMVMDCHYNTEKQHVIWTPLTAVFQHFLSCPLGTNSSDCISVASFSTCM